MSADGVRVPVDPAKVDVHANCAASSTTISARADGRERELDGLDPGRP